DYYNTEAHSEDLYLPIGYDNNNDEEQYIGFFHTGAYQEALAGYGGIQHCLIPAPKHVLIDLNEEGELVTSLFSKEQTSDSMLKLLGYYQDAPEFEALIEEKQDEKSVVHTEEESIFIATA
ncbi:MAG: arginine decarboxylase, partial [Spirosomaceae bacterium]|nr:arginine decarboxylase [Spirosomataceae bacterium]